MDSFRIFSQFWKSRENEGWWVTSKTFLKYPPYTRYPNRRSCTSETCCSHVQSESQKNTLHPRQRYYGAIKNHDIKNHLKRECGTSDFDGRYHFSKRNGSFLQKWSLFCLRAKIIPHRITTTVRSTLAKIRKIINLYWSFRYMDRLQLYVNKWYQHQRMQYTIGGTLPTHHVQSCGS